ncbi:bifunctional glycosyltransferase/class I SAM-dependent methyltransferase [Fibrobacterota bacterium]
MNKRKKRSKVLVFIVAYNAEATIENVLKRIPKKESSYDMDVLIIDDSSDDKTFEKGLEYQNFNEHLPVKILRNPDNQGYGGNQKIGYNYALKHEYDIVVLLHGDGQYAPEYLPKLIRPILDGESGAVFGSRMKSYFAALKGGMPFYKFIGNRILTFSQNSLMKTGLSEWHSGYRAYSVSLLKEIPYERNDNGFPFDTDIILQLIQNKTNIKEVPIPTYYGDEICHVNGILYGMKILASTFKCRLHNMNLTYERKYDCSYKNQYYPLKMGYDSSHTFTLSEIKKYSSVLDIGCGSGLLAKEIKKKECRVIGIDDYEPVEKRYFDIFIKSRFPEEKLNLENDLELDYILLLDVIEHVAEPEEFLDEIRNLLMGRKCTVIITSPNIAFFINRLQLLFGRFNYVKRGILDKTHFHLFTFASLKKLLERSGYKTILVKGVPAPCPEVIKNRLISLFLVKVNVFLIKIFRNLFSYQIFIKAMPYATVDALLLDSEKHSSQLTKKFKAEK